MKKYFSLLVIFLSIFICGKVHAYKIYKIGDEVRYNDIDFYVIKDSSSDEEIVTLLKAEPLTVEEVNTYGEGRVNNYVTNDTNDPAYKKATNNNGYGGIRYYGNINCGINSQNVWVYDECDYDYEKSDIKIVVDNWVNDKKSKI